MEDDAIGLVSTTFSRMGRVRLDFGNCWTSGTVKAYLDGIRIASARGNTTSKTVEFNVTVGSILKITEIGAIIQFNSLEMIQCNVGEYLYQYY